MYGNQASRKGGSWLLTEKIFCMVGGILLPLWAAGVAAAQPPDAGTTLQQLQQQQTPELIPHKEAPPALQSPTQKAPQPASQGIRFQVGAIRVSGATLFSENQLLDLVRDAIGRPLTLPQLHAYSTRITTFYRDRGYILARAYLPPQDIQEGGTVEIAIVEGRYGAIELQNHSRLRKEVAKLAVAELKSGNVVEQDVLDRTLLLLNDTPGVTAKGTLAPGSLPGTTDLSLDLEPLPLVSGSVAIDNYGSRYTGQVRAGGTLNLNNPSGYGDWATFRLFTSATGLDAGYLGWISPALAHGARFGASYADTHYRLGKEFAVLDAHGDARVASVHFSYPFIRSRTGNLYGQAGYDNKWLEDRVDATNTITSKRADVWWLGLSGNAQDGIGGGGYNTFSAIYSQGNIRLHEAAALTLDESTARTNGGYGKLGFNLARQQVMTNQLRLHASLSGQIASRNLDSSEKFQLGGANGVRAYPQGETPADEAVLLTLELRYTPKWTWSIPGTVQLVGFIDSGRATRNKNPWPGLTGDNHRTLSGAGIGLHWSSPDDFAITAGYAFGIGSARATAEEDKPGRFWLQIVKYF